MNNSDHISPYRQSTSPTYQNAHILSNPEIIQKLPVDVLEMIERGDLDGAMAKLKEHAQENETLMSLLFQLMGEMTASFFKPFSMMTARFTALFPSAPKKEGPPRKDRVINDQDPQKLKTEKDFELYMRSEVTKINMDPKPTEKKSPFPPAVVKLHQIFQSTLLAAMAGAAKNFNGLISHLPIKQLAGFQAKMMANLISFAKMADLAIKNFGNSLDQKIFVPIAKGIAAPFIFLGKQLEPIIKPLVERFSYANKFNKKKTTKKEPIIPKFLEPLAEKLKTTKNRLLEIKKSVFETFSELKHKIVEKAKNLAFSFVPKPLVRFVETGFRRLPEYANNIKEVIQQNVAILGHALQQINQLATTTLQPMVNLFVSAQRTTMKYSLAGIKWIHKKMQDSFSKAKKRVYEKLEGLANKTIKTAKTVWKASCSTLKKLAEAILSLLKLFYQAFKDLFFKSIYLIWPVIKNGSFIFWVIISTIPKAGWFLIHRELNKIKKVLLHRLRKNKKI